MKKALLILVAILAVTFILGNAGVFSEFAVTFTTGELIPLIIAIIVMAARYIIQAASYETAFEAVGFKTGYWHNVVLIFSLLFINTFCLFSGATGVAFIIDDARRRGADIGTATSGAILTQIGYFCALLVISVVGMLVMLISDSMNTIFLIGALLLVGTLLMLSSFFVIGYFKPGMLIKFLTFVEKGIRRVLSLFKKNLRKDWGAATAQSFIDSARVLAKNPVGVAITMGYATLSALMNMACLVAIGFAFGFDEVVPLVAAFAVAAISIQLSPTPQGIGVTEAAITMILTAYGCSLASAAAIALVYRGIMLWLPFFVGAILLSQSGFFKEKKDPTEEHRRKDVAWVTGTLMGLLGVVNIGLSLFGEQLISYEVLTQFVDLGVTLFGILQVIGGIVLLLLAVGLVFRSRTVWALSMSVLVILAGMQIYFGVFQVAIPVLALAVWLFFQREAFDKTTLLTKVKERFLPSKGEEQE